MSRVRTAAVRHPGGVDAGFAALLAAADLPAALNGRSGVAGVLWFAAAHVPLIRRRRSPVVVFWTVLAVAVAAWTVGGVDTIYPFVPLLVATYTLTRHRPWRQAWPVVAVVAVLVTGWQQGDLRSSDLVALIAALSAAGLLGVTLRTRRAYVAGLEERARQLARDRDQQAELAAAAERTRIAREMHDIVAHNLAVLIALADGAALTATADPQRAADTLTLISDTGREALGEMQRLLGLLRDGTSADRAAFGLSPPPGLDDIPRLVAQVRDAGPRMTLVCEGTPGNWGPGAGLTLFRIVQEASTNILKHAGPTATARIRLRYTSTSAEVEITDDGAHRAVAAPTTGHGLAGVIERVAAYHGRVEAGPLPGAGWRVHATLHFGRPGEGT